ncbi:MAG: tetratricopeptide repeat protein [Candidatus Lokiarchaeota archaeon]|nr:tetratricopeptide repeat protein [Candidatus Lokiarchaeota archaeon]
MDSTDPWAIADGAIERFNQGEFPEAIELFIQSIQASPSEPCLHFNLALALAKLGENLVALDVLKKGLDLDPHDKQALKLLSVLHTITKQKDWDARSAQSFAWIGRFLKSKEFLVNYPDVTDADRVIAAIITTTTAFPYAAGHAPVSRGRRVAMPPANAVQLDVYAGGVVMCYAFLSLPCLSGNAPESVMDYILGSYECLADDEKGTGLLWVFERGRRHYEDADYQEAARILEALVAVEPTNLAILFYCGKALRDSGEVELVNRSLDYYKRILQLNYENALGWYDLSLSYAFLGDFQKELFCLKRAYDLGHSKQDIDRITYLEGIVAPVDPFG